MMNIAEMIEDYRSAKQELDSFSANQGAIVSLLERRLGGLMADTHGHTIAMHIKQAWPDAQPGTRARYTRQLRAIFSHHGKHEGVTRSSDIPTPAYFDERDITATGKELRQLLDYVLCHYTWAYPAITTLLHTGARLNEAHKISLACDYQRHTLTIRQDRAKKTKTIQRKIPATKRLRRGIELGLIADPIFRTETGKTIVSPSAAGDQLRPVLAQSCAAIGIDRLTVHDLRHGCAVLIAEAGGALDDIAAVLGHTSLATTKRYRGLVLSRSASLLGGIV